ncbi:MAG: PrsW family glutamic-type intramembrane protease [Polyangiaceae bacterium]
MSAKAALFIALTGILPVLVTLALSLRRDEGQSQRRLYLVLLTLGIGVVASLGSLALQRGIAVRVGIDAPDQSGSDLLGAAYFFLVVGPLNQLLVALTCVPGLRSSYHHTPYDTMRVASAAAVGFSAVQISAIALQLEPTGVALAREVSSVTSHVAFASLWGYALGRSGRKTLTGTWFARAFVGAAVLTGIIDYLLFSRGVSALVATTPLLVSTTAVTLLMRRDLRALSRLPVRKRRILRVDPPSLEQIRDALRAHKRPVAIRWVVFGTFVTTGVMTAAVALGVYIGHRAGIDFSAVDSGASESAVSALVLLGTSVLAAFPISGFLLARASGAEGVLEPALGAAFAIGGIVILLGLAAPVAVVFALAFAPVAFALACVGAWIGQSR